MKILVGIVLAITCASAHTNLDDLIEEINNKQNLWTAGKNFNGASLSEIRGLFGTKKLPEYVLRSIPVKVHDINPADIPESFDARTKWPKCKSIGKVRDQSACDCAWAISTTSVITDRTCIYYKATINPEISTRYLIACEGISSGCYGGYTYYGLQFWRHNGLVTGGDYGSETGCQPYPFEPCGHHNLGHKSPCSNVSYATPQCIVTCDNSSLVFKKERHQGALVYQLKSVPQIQAEIMTNGPVTADFTISEDFVVYKSGVYSVTSDNVLGRHSVKLIGWGVENGTDYWLGINSWNEEWGDKGYFKFLRGVNECTIEQEVFGGTARF